MRPDTKTELLEALTVERFAAPVPEYHNVRPATAAPTTDASRDEPVIRRVELELALADDEPHDGEEMTTRTSGQRPAHTDTAYNNAATDEDPTQDPARRGTAAA